MRIELLFLLSVVPGVAQERRAEPSNSLGHALAIFSALDADRDGRLDAGEMRRIAGARSGELAAEDVDRDGRLDRGEFLVLHRRLVLREGVTPAPDLDLEVARIQVRRRARGLLPVARRTEAEGPAGGVAGAEDAAARRAAAPSDRLAPAPSAGTPSELELRRAFHGFEQQVLSGAPSPEIVARLRKALEGRADVERLARGGDADREDPRTPEALLRELEAELETGGERAVALLWMLRRRLGFERSAAERAAASRAGAAPCPPVAVLDAPRAEVPCAGLRAGRLEAALAELEQALAQGRVPGTLARRVRSLACVSAAKPAEVATALDALLAAARRGEPTRALLDAVRDQLGRE